MPSRGWLKAKVGTVLGVVVGVLAATATMGCGPYEPEPATPYGYWVRAEPPTSAELAANPPGRVSAGDEVAIGEAEGAAVIDTDPSALTEFREVLAPHGAWVEDDTYGTVWVPREDVVGADFEPYVTAGRWTYDDASANSANSDWVWVSDYSWGWAPFHYGRWVRLPGRGWSWIPGRTYSGAWVTWRTGPVGYGYVGWAPMAPSWYWSRGVAVGWGFGWYSPYYVYCPTNYIYHHHDHVVRNGPAYQDAQARTQPRTVANPGVGGGERTVASPGVAGRNVASPGVGGRGPSPSELGHAPDAIARPPANDPGLSRARAMASSRSTAREGLASRSLRDGAGNTVVGQPSQRLGQAGAASPRVSSRLDATARAPGYHGVQPSSPRSSFGSPNGSAYAAPPPAVRQSPGYASPSSPSFRSNPSSSPSYRSSPSFGSSPSVSSSPSFRSSPSSSPSFRSSPSTGSSFRSSPSSGGSFRLSPSSGGSFRSSPSSGGSFRSSPSSGGSFRGGGGGGGGSMRGGGGFRGGRGR